ncbi:hypothetical protein PHSY_005033 [Pseudozyma hubeiensis SY62]|uniref:Uncharacterized protein n=1 Tax=Pseudozyma hubeiensis (strain SY62) TaxID=1305764 RepID=R9P876_PSEHS|nr:hypothetical protein PHSY_005033 [Pseudozyma hubeiensis SY62]GAC97447.1 hypothetical protein PHSY_005033 [Pseudozyma hubeiensis SY62]
MTDNTAPAPTHKPRRLFTRLAPALVHLVNDRFDEDQYDQAVELLEQLRVEGVRPPQSLIQKLLALSLCSLAPGQIASSSRWTLDHQLHDIAARLSTQHKGSRGDSNVMKAASATSDRPSESAVLKASSLLVRYAHPGARTCAKDTKGKSAAEREASLLARHVLESLPSQRKPLQSSKSVSPDTSRRKRRGSERPDDSEHDGSFDASPLEQWIRDRLYESSDVWDLLSGRRFSHVAEGEEASLGRVSEFWMNNSERKRYQKQLQARASSDQRLEDRLKDIRWKKLNGALNSDSSDLDSDDATDEENPNLKFPVGALKRSEEPSGKRKAPPSPGQPVKRRPHTSKSEGPFPRQDEQHPTMVKLTEGAWRTLSVLLCLWDLASPQPTVPNIESSPLSDNEPPLLWQFPHNHQPGRNGRLTSNIPPSGHATAEIDRALDVAFSFPEILPAYTSVSLAGSAVASNLFDKARSSETRGDARPFSSVHEAELLHRQEVGGQKQEGLTAARADTAAWLLVSMYDLAKFGYISAAALIEGMSERMYALQANEMQHLVVPLLIKEPYLVASVLARSLTDTTLTRPDKKRTPDLVQFCFDGQGTVSMDASLAYAMPQENSSIDLLRKAIRHRDRDARAVLHFLSLNKLDLDNAADSTLPLSLPTRSESRKQSVVRKQSRRHIKIEPDPRKKAKMTLKLESSAAAVAVVTDEMKKGGLVAFASVRTLQMEARARIDQIKFFLAQAIFSGHAASLRQDNKLEAAKSTRNTTAEPAQASKQPDVEIAEAKRASQHKNLQLFLTRLYKALEHDVGDFRTCLAAMKTHLSKDSANRRRKNLADLIESTSIDRDASVALPSFDVMVERCQKCVAVTQDLAHTARMLLESTKLM